MQSNYWQRALLRHSRRRFLQSAGTVAVGGAGLGLVGCGGDDDDDAADGENPTTRPDSTSEVSAPKQGGTLRYSISRDPPTLNPYENINALTQTNSAPHYSRLMRSAVGPDILPTDYTKIEGDLAEGMPEQPDDLTYTFTLKPGIFFHDKAPMNGREATAQDFIATWDYFRSTAINASRFNQVVQSMEATDDRTITIKLVEPSAPFLVVGAASDQGVWFIPIETINSDQHRTDPVGTGPFIFRAWESGVRMAWDRHPNWYDGPRPYFDRIEAAPLNDVQRRLVALQDGEFDRSDVIPNQLPEVEAIEPQGTVNILPNSSVITFMFNLDNGNWGDKRVRQALSMSLDRDGYLSVLDPTGTQPWNSFFGPALVPYFMSPQDEKWGESSKYFQKDLTEAKALLSAATGSDTLNLTAVSNVDSYGPAAQQQWELIVSDLRGAGYNAQNVYQEYGAYIQSSYFGQLTDPNSVTLGHLFGTILDPDDIFMASFWSQSSRHNWSGTPIPEQAELDEMYLKQRQLLDLEERTEYIQEIQRKMGESLLVIPIVNPPGAHYIQSWVKDAWHKQSYATIPETYSRAYFTDERIARG